MIKIFLIQTIVLLSFPFFIFCSFEYGGLRDIGAKAFGMAGAYLAVGSDADMIYWNPACLAKNKKFKQFSLSYSYLLLDILPQGFIGFSTPEKGKGSFGLGIFLFGSSSVYSEEMVIFSYSKSLVEQQKIMISFGGSLKYMTKGVSLENEGGEIIRKNITNFGFDAGGLFQYGERVKNLNFSCVYRGFLKSEEATNEYLRLGASYNFRINNNLATISCDYDLDTKGVYLGVDAEVVKGLLFLRCGYNTYGVDVSLKNYSFGFGIVYFPWRVDYAVVYPIEVELGVIHKFSLDIKF